MKQYIFLITIFLLTAIPVIAVATPTASPSANGSPTATAIPNQIDDLKERLATKVAEMRQSQKKAISGTVKSITISTLTIETRTSDVKIELTDTLKVIQTIKGQRTVLTTDDIDKGDAVVVFGDYDTSLDLMKAKVIVIQNALPQRVSGKITNIDQKEFTITIETPEKQSYIIDIEKTTNIQSFLPESGVQKSGFSKIENGSTIHVTGITVPKTEHRISALRILNIGNPAGNTPTPTPSIGVIETATASATSKPLPTKKATPTPTPKG